VRDYLRRLLSTGAAYQAAEIVAKGIALFTLPLYTRHVSRGEYGAYNTLLTSVILASIVLRLGVGEAFVRFYFEDADAARRERIARTATATVAWTTTVAALAAVAFAGPLSRLLLGEADAELLDCAVVGLWAFTNLEMAYAQLRVDERARAYMYASGANVAMTVLFTVALVVFAGEGARGLLLGNFGASALVVLGLWWVLRRRFSLRVRLADLRAMLRFGLPTVPADASVYALQVVDRLYIFRAYSHEAAGEYSVALQLATVVFVFVRGFQYAWPPLAYSVQSDREAARLYSLVTTYFVLGTGVVVCAVALLGRWMVRLLAAPSYFGAHTALPWLALGWTLYGLYLVLIVITGRAGDPAQPPAGAGGARGQRGAAARAGALLRRGAGDRGRGPRAVRGVRGDARGPAPAHPRRVRRRLPVGAPRAAGRDPRGRGGLGRAAAADRRPRRPRAARGVAGVDPGAAGPHALLPPHRARPGGAAAQGCPPPGRRLPRRRGRRRGVRGGPAARPVRDGSGEVPRGYRPPPARLYASAASRSPSPRSGRNAAVTWRQYRRGE
jgi:O-antigen/teichoic acid export membrane protein